MIKNKSILNAKHLQLVLNIIYITLMVKQTNFIF